jgi:hypothetical protein
MEDTCAPFVLMKSMNTQMKTLLITLSATLTQKTQAQFLAGFDDTVRAMTTPALNTT